MAQRFEELIERHHDEIFSYLWRLIGTARRSDIAPDAEDLVQEVFMRAYQAYLRLPKIAITEPGSTRSQPIVR